MWWQFLLVFAFAPGCMGDRYAFFTKMQEEGLGASWTRRVFGGRTVHAQEFSAACVLLDHSMRAKCSCSVLAPRWALTAAHCARSADAYVRFNNAGGQSSIVAIHLLYSHPKYKVVERDEGDGMDVVLLHNDVGLVRTRNDMDVAAPRRLPGVHPDPLQAMLTYNPELMYGEEVEMLGYGSSEYNRAGGMQLRAVRLRVSACERNRDAWRRCACARGPSRGVCAGDSGGPVMFKGVQVGVTSMGPVTCSPTAWSSSNISQPSVTSVFTSTQPYVPLLNATIYNLRSAMSMTPIAPHSASAKAALASNFATTLTMLCVFATLS